MTATFKKIPSPIVVMNTDRLGPLERTIMEVFWEKKQADARDVFSELNKTKKIAYTTINTTLTRLHKKRLLNRKLVKGRGGYRYVYTIAKSKPTYVDHVIRSTIDDLLMRFGNRTISYFSESLNLSDEDVEKLRSRLKELSHE
jgi:predicted transcriptional regulator